MINSKTSPLIDLIKRKNSQVIHDHHKNTQNDKISSKFTTSTQNSQKKFGSTSPIERVSNFSNSSSSQLSLKKFVKQSEK